MADKVTVTSRHSYGSRVKNSFAKIWVWFIFVIGSIIWIFMNEKNFLETKVALTEWAEIVKETISTEINPELDQAEVHLYWETSSSAEALQDSVFWVIVDDLKLARNVSMYQWTEESEEHCTDNVGWSEDCTTTYTYSKAWEDYAVNSSSFYESAWHENPTEWKYQSQDREKSPIMLWVYTLDSVFVDRLSNYRSVDLSSQEIIIPEEYKVSGTTSTETSENVVEDNNNNYLYWEWENETAESWIKFHVYSDHIYIWANEWNPQVWDLKITFSSVKPWTVSVVWQQVWNNLTTYTASNWKPIALLENWQVTAENMFMHAQDANKKWTRFLRGVLLLLMFAWFSMMLEFITTLAKVLPFLSRIIGVWTGVIAFALTLVFGFLAFGISRLAVRPVVWLICLAVAIFGIVMLVRAKKSKKSEKWNGSTPMPTNDKDVEIIEA